MTTMIKRKKAATTPSRRTPITHEDLASTPAPDISDSHPHKVFQPHCYKCAEALMRNHRGAQAGNHKKIQELQEKLDMLLERPTKLDYAMRYLLAMRAAQGFQLVFQRFVSWLADDSDVVAQGCLKQLVAMSKLTPAALEALPSPVPDLADDTTKPSPAWVVKRVEDALPDEPPNEPFVPVAQLQRSLENIRMLVATRRKSMPESIAMALLRFCKEAGVEADPLRELEGVPELDPNARVTRCDEGHAYDAATNKSCPTCAGLLAGLVRAAVGREAAASVALDNDPDLGTHSVDDDCPGGHREPT